MAFPEKSLAFYRMLKAKFYPQIINGRSSTKWCLAPYWKIKMISLFINEALLMWKIYYHLNSAIIHYKYLIILNHRPVFMSWGCFHTIGIFHADTNETMTMNITLIYKPRRYIKTVIRFNRCRRIENVWVFWHFECSSKLIKKNLYTFRLYMLNQHCWYVAARDNIIVSFI